MCEYFTCETVRVKIPADLSATGKEVWKEKSIDSCIADLVRALQAGGIDMRGSCCGHGADLGHIALQDGRVLVIADAVFYDPLRWGWMALWRGIRLSLRVMRRTFSSQIQSN